MKKMLFLVLLVPIVSQAAFDFTAEMIDLRFENVKIENLEFYQDSVVKVDNGYQIEVFSLDQEIFISSDKKAKITVFLPDNETYRVKKNDVVCIFDNEKLKVTADDGTVVEYSNSNFVINNPKDAETIIINKDGVFISNKKENISIDSEGISIIEEEEKGFGGFWGKLLGGVVRTIIRASLNHVGDTPQDFARYFINEDVKMHEN
jgi:hypothetical protein